MAKIAVAGLFKCLGFQTYHSIDLTGKDLIKKVISVCKDKRFRGKIFFVEGYDIRIARHLVQGVDVWINTPRRPWEACGTSGMKVLVNGGLNLSELDGWWAEAYTPEVGWALGDGKEHDSAPDWDAAGETAVIYLKMYAKATGNYVQIGDIVLNYTAL